MKKYKNITILLALMAATIIICIYALKWHSVYEKNDLNTPVITSYIQEVKSDEFNNYVSDNPYSVIYFCIPSDSNCRSFENKFKDYILNNNLKETIVYLNVNNIDGADFAKDFDRLYNSSELRKQDKYLTEVPTVAIYNHVNLADFVGTSDLTVDKVDQFLKAHNLVGD